MLDLSELPDELQAGSAEPRPRRKPALSEERRAERLNALGTLIAGKRDAAVKARKESGIEEVWMECEDAYLGVDDANRSEFAKARWAKSTTMQGPLTTSAIQQSGNKSTAYVRLTTRYVDMGAAKLSEIVLPIDDKPFAFGPTPVPDLVNAKDDPTPVQNPDGSMQWRDASDEDMAGLAQGNPVAAFMGPQGGMVPQVPVTKGDLARKELQKAGRAADKAEQRVYDWLVESRYPLQMRKVIHDGSRLGVGVLKGPFPDERTRKSYAIKNGVGTLAILRKVAPGAKWVDPWNFFPHGGCGEDVHSGEYIFERDFMLAGTLGKLKTMVGLPTEAHPSGEPIYLPQQIEKVLAEGPDKCNTEQGQNPNSPDTKEGKSRFTIWHFYGTLNRDDMEALGAPGADELPDEVVSCYCQLTLVNDTIIRAAFNPLEKSGNFPYRVFPWSRRAGHWAGVGVAEQVKLPQRMVNAGTRAWLNNAGKTAGAQYVLDQRAITPADGNWEITPDKLWYLTSEAAADDIRKMFMSVELPDRGASLFRIIEYAFKLAEEQSNIPLISQGQAGPNDPQTFGQAELQNNNANTLLRQLAYTLDDCVTEPLVNDLYEWLLLDPDVPDDEKGDFEINARGSIAMVEKAIQEQTLAMMLGLAKDPTWGQDPKKLFAEFMRAKRLDPDKTAYTDEELAKLQSQPQPKAPAVEAAEIRAASAEKIAAAREQTAQVRIKSDVDRDTAYTQSLARRDEASHAARMEELAQRERIAIAEWANKRQITLDEAKVELAKAAMELRTQVRLTMMGKNGASSQVADPAFEPPGRAQPGYAFTQ